MVISWAASSGKLVVIVVVPGRCVRMQGRVLSGLVTPVCLFMTPVRRMVHEGQMKRVGEWLQCKAQAYEDSKEPSRDLLSLLVSHCAYSHYYKEASR